MASFSTVSLIREEPEVVRRFIDFYCRAGADEILIYWDGAAPDLGDLPTEVVLVDCDKAFWDGMPGGRPEGLEDRQSAIYQAGLARCRSGWLLVVDADEFVFGDRPIAAFLDGVPADADSVSVATAEAVWGPGDDIAAPFGSTHFRKRWRSHRLWSGCRRAVYGEVASYMQYGLTGHIAGKEFLRAGRPYSWIRNHSAERDGVGITRPAARLNPELAQMYVGHFDAIGIARWTQKWRQRIRRDTLANNMTPSRVSQMNLVAERLDRGEGEALFRAFYGLSPLQYAALSTLGYAFRRDIFAQ